MKIISCGVAAIVAAFMLSAAPASAQLLGGDGVGGLVGGVVDGVLGGGGGGSLGSTIGGITDTVIGDHQGNGVVQDVIGSVGLGDTFGNGQLLDLNTSGNGQIGVPGVVTGGVDSRGGVHVGGVLLGGGGPSVNLPLPVLGGNSGISVQLPRNVGGINIGGTPGPRGPQGLPGANGNNGGGRVVVVPGGGGGGASGVINNSSRLKLLARVLQSRAWLRFAQGNKICLPQFGVANVSNWVKPSEYAALNQLIASYSGDIATLQQMMKRCRNGQERLVDASRVIGVDFKDGQLVVMTM